MTGRLDGTLLGRPVQIEAQQNELVVSFDNMRSAWATRKSASVAMIPLLRALKRGRIALTLQIPGRRKIEILPRPGFAVRLLVPALRGLNI